MKIRITHCDYISTADKLYIFIKYKKSVDALSGSKYLSQKDEFETNLYLLSRKGFTSRELSELRMFRVVS